MKSGSRFPVLLRFPLPALQPYVQEAVERYMAQAELELDAKEVRKTDVKLKGEIRLLPDKDRIITEFPIEVETRVLPSLFKGLGVLNLLDNLSQISFTVQLRLQTHLQLSPQGQLQSSTHAEYHWEQKPKAGLVSLAGAMGGLVEDKLTEICYVIDSTIHKEVPIPTYETDVWRSLHQWEQIEQDPPLWFAVRPSQRATDRKLLIEGNELQLNAQLAAAPEVRLQADQPRDTEVPPLPSGYETLTEEISPQSIVLRSSLPQLNQYLSQQQIKDDSEDLTISQPQLLAHDKEWELRLQLEGKAYGLTLKGDVSLFLEIDTSENKPVLRLIRKDLHEVSLALRVALWWWSDEKIQARLQTELDQLLADIAGAIGHAWATLSLDEPFH
ncbi:MAG: DUF4403 family protein, partial [Bacteroidota bacterium]